MIPMGVGDDDILDVLEQIGGAVLLREMEDVAVGIYQQIVIDEDGGIAAEKFAVAVGSDIPVCRAGAEKGDFLGEISLQK